MKKFLSKIFCMVLLLSVALIGATALIGGNSAYAFEGEEEIFYGDAILDGTSNETVNFSRKVVTEKLLAHPNIISTSNNKEYDCVATSAANAIMYYDRYRSNLIDGTHGANVNGIYNYISSSAAAQSLVNNLFSLMNGNSSGVTYTNCKNAIQNYVTGRGYTITFSDMRTNSKLDFSKTVTYIDGSRPIMIYTNGNFRLVNINENTSSTSYNIQSYNGSHCITAFGYKKVEYFNAANTLIRTDYFYKVASDMTGSYSWLQLEDGLSVSYADAIYIK